MSLFREALDHHFHKNMTKKLLDAGYRVQHIAYLVKCPVNEIQNVADYGVPPSTHSGMHFFSADFSPQDDIVSIIYNKLGNKDSEAVIEQECLSDITDTFDITSDIIHFVVSYMETFDNIKLDIIKQLHHQEGSLKKVLSVFDMSTSEFFILQRKNNKGSDSVIAQHSQKNLCVEIPLPGYGVRTTPNYLT